MNRRTRKDSDQRDRHSLDARSISSLKVFYFLRIKTFAKERDQIEREESLCFSDRLMTTIILDGLDARTSREQVESYCQSYGRILNCYIKSSQCTVTFANVDQAEEFLRSSPHRLDAFSFVPARSKSSIQPTKSHSIDQSRLIVEGNDEQLKEKSLVEYFSQYGSVRMCQIFADDQYAIITFDRSQTCEAILKQSRHFLHGRSLKIELDSSNRKRMKRSASPVKEDPTKIHLQEQLIKQQYEHQLQIVYYQNLLKQMADEVVKREQQIEQLKKENQDIE